MVVMKFGGTSVADRAAIERLMAIVRAQRQADAQQEGGDARGPVVVVSALSGVTDRLLGIAAQAGARWEIHRGTYGTPALVAAPAHGFDEFLEAVREAGFLADADLLESGPDTP